MNKTHAIKMGIGGSELSGKSTVEFEIRQGRRLLGTLMVSRTSLAWRHRRKGFACKIDWPDVPDLFAVPKAK